MKTLPFVCASLFVASLLAGTGCAGDPASPTGETASELAASHGQCSKSLAQAVRESLDQGDSDLDAISASALPSTAKAKLKALNDSELAADESDIRVKPFKLVSPAGTAFVLYFNGGDDDGVIVEVYSTSGSHLLSGDAPCGCESIDWTDHCSH